MERLPKVVLFDLWRTLGYSLDRDPILDVQEILGHSLVLVDGQVEVCEDPDFMRSCLTTNLSNPVGFLDHLASTFGRPLSSEASHQSFARVLERETADFVFYEDTLPALQALKEQGYRLGLISNLWPFPVRVLFDELGLGAYFEHMIYSFEVGHAKPEPEIFEKALELFGVAPEDVLMVGDNPVNDVQGAMAVGMQAALIDRSGEQNVIVPGAMVLRSLLDLCKSDPASIQAA